VRSVILIVKKQKIFEIICLKIYLSVLLASFQSIEIFTKSLGTLLTHSYTSVIEGR